MAPGKRLLRKTLTYRDRSGRSQEQHREAWRGFEWSAGRFIVAAQGPWGTVQVWASSHAEGERVARKALQEGGWNPDTDPDVEWNYAIAAGERYGRVCTVRTLDTRQGLAVSKRSGPNGPPNLSMGPQDQSDPHP